MTINVGDFREIDLCSLVPRLRSIFAPTESGYNGPRLLGLTGSIFMGSLRVTIENAKGVKKTITIASDMAATGLTITLEN